MKLSILVIFYNMQREGPRTLQSLAPGYQRDVDAADYEVIAIDNGSDRPLDAGRVTALGDGFRYHYHDTASPSPVAAINLGAGMAQGDNIALIIDGARMASPGLVAQTLRALDLADRPVVAAVSAHLGPEAQRFSRDAGYGKDVEDAMLDASGWPQDGYALFDIGTLAPSSRLGYLGGFPPECSWIALPRPMWDALGGFDQGFQAAGGGLAAMDFRNRAVTLDGAQPVMLLGEAVFHQIHDGAATGTSHAANPMARFGPEFEALRGTPPYKADCADVIYFGRMTQRSAKFAQPVHMPAVSKVRTAPAPTHLSAGRQPGDFARPPILVTGLEAAPLGGIARLLEAHGTWAGSGSIADDGTSAWFDLFLDRQAWINRFPRDPEVLRALGLFHRAMTQGDLRGDADAAAALDALGKVISRLGTSAPEIARKQAFAALKDAAPPPAQSHPCWAAASALAHLVLPQLNSAIPDLRVIHVIGDPIVAAHGSAHGQTRSWGSYLLGERVHFDPIGSLRTRALDYWLAAHTRALTLCREVYPDRHLVLSPSDMAEAPDVTARRILHFAGLPEAEGATATLDWSAPPAPDATGDLPSRLIDAARALLDGIPRHD